MKQKFPNLNKKKKILITFLVIYLLLIPVFLFAVGKTGDNPDVLGSNSGNGGEENVNMVEKAKLLAELPTEDPLVSTIENASSLRDQIFFKKAQDGDILLIFKEAKRGVIYRPGTNQIIENTTIDVVTEAKPAPAVEKSPTTQNQKILNTETNVTLSPSVSPLPKSGNEDSPTPTP